MQHKWINNQLQKLYCIASNVKRMHCHEYKKRQSCLFWDSGILYIKVTTTLRMVYCQSMEQNLLTGQQISMLTYSVEW
jgi:hypothetical protein